MCDKLKILHIINALSVGGTEQMLSKLVTSMDPNHFHHYVLTLTPGGEIAKLLRAQGIAVIVVDLTHKWKIFFKLFTLIKIVKRLQPDLIHGWMYHSNLVATLLKKFNFSKSTAVVWSVRTSLVDYKEKPWFARFIIQLGKRLSQSPDRIIFNSVNSRKQHLHFGYNRACSIVIPNGFNTSIFKKSMSHQINFREQFQLSKRQFLIGIIARYHADKDHLTFLQAASLFQENNPNARFILVGYGIDKSNSVLVAHIESLNLDVNTLLLGQQLNPETIIPAMDIVCLSSINEAFPNIVGEAMACEVPCVATDVGDSKIIIAKTGLIVPTKSPQLLAKAWQQIADMTMDERRDLGRQAREKICTHYDIAAIVQQYEQLYYACVATLKRNDVCVV